MTMPAFQLRQSDCHPTQQGMRRAATIVNNASGQSMRAGGKSRAVCPLRAGVWQKKDGKRKRVCSTSSGYGGRKLSALEPIIRR